MVTGLSGLQIPIHLEEPDGLRREAEPVRMGVPLPAGRVHDPRELVLTDAAGEPIPHQFAALAFWADKSVKWLLMDALVRLAPRERTRMFIRVASEIQASRVTAPVLNIAADEDVITIDTGAGQFTVERRGAGPITGARVAGQEMLQRDGSRIRLT